MLLRKQLLKRPKKSKKLHGDVIQFMVDFRKSSNENTSAVNKVIAGLDFTLQTEKESLWRVFSALRVDNSELNIAIESYIEKLQSDLAVENNLMDKLAQKTEKAKHLSLKLTYANKHVEDLELQKIILKSCVLEVNHYQQRLVETHDSLLIVSLRQHLADKLKPVFSMLNRI